MENIDMNAVEAIMWFFGGIFTYRILTKLLNYGYMVNMYKELLFSVLMLLRIADENFIKANKSVRDTAAKSGRDENEIELEYESNVKILHVWRNLIVATIVQMTPKNFEGLVQFKNWRQAMKLLETKGETSDSN